MNSTNHFDFHLPSAAAAAASRSNSQGPTNRSSRRILLSPFLISFLSFSLVGCCSSEALVSSSTSFLPRSLWMRGGSEGTKSSNPSLTCVLQVPRSSTASMGGMNDNDEPVSTTGNKKALNGVNGKSINGGATETIAFVTKRTNGVHKNSNGSSSNNNNNNNRLNKNGVGSKKRVDDANFMDVPIPATFVAETNLPTDVGQFRLRAYRTPQASNEFTGNEPCVIYATDKPPFGDSNGGFRENVPVRIHDQCLTSEVFRSKRCDCKEQLKMALEYIAENGGAIIYLQQEGRGIGLANKVAAYSLQDDGMDTVDANLHLGFPEDARQYGAVPNILKDMKIGSIQLMTNNPRKVHRLRALGVEISETLPMVVPKTNPYNHRYLEAKHQRMAHTNLSPLFVRNGNMIPKRMSLAEEYVTEGEEMAANAIQVSLSQNSTIAVVDGIDDDDEEQVGVTAHDDGYCFGRQSVEDAIDAVREGKMVVVVDDMDRENEGDLIMASEACTPEDMAKIVRYSSGVICIAMEGRRMDELNLPAMVVNNEDPKSTAFSVTVDATREHGITTGISAADRAKTVNLLADPKTKASDFSRPGHIFPLRARDGGVLERDGHTEAAVDLAILAGRGRSGILCEIVSEENPTEMARLPELKRFCQRHGFVLTSIVDIAQYRREQSQVDENLSI